MRGRLEFKIGTRTKRDRIATVLLVGNFPVRNITWKVKYEKQYHISLTGRNQQVIRDFDYNVNIQSRPS